jgi:hypothetical protein
MSQALLPRTARSEPPVAPHPTVTIGVVLVAWLALVVALGARGAFVTPAGTPPVRLLIGVTMALIVFLIGLSLSDRFREVVATADLRLMTAIQAWRFAGLGFLALYAHGVLPGLFAWPAGLGDIAIGVTAPWILVALVRDRRFAASKTFVVWNLLGVLDLVVAIGMGALNSWLALDSAAEVTTRPMAVLPLVVIPAYLVPIFVMLHVAALVQARRVARDPRGQT